MYNSGEYDLICKCAGVGIITCTRDGEGRWRRRQGVYISHGTVFPLVSGRLRGVREGKRQLDTTNERQ